MSETPSPPPTGGLNLPANLIPQRSAGLKLLLVCALALLMAIPALFVYMVVAERTMGQRLALAEVSESAGGPQTVLPPVIVLPFSRVPVPERPSSVVYGQMILFAEAGELKGSVDVEERVRGIYPVPVFTGNLAFKGEFDLSTLTSGLPAGASPIWQDARLYVGVTDTRGLKDAVRLTFGSADLSFEPAVTNYAMAASAAPFGEGYQPVPDGGVSLASAKIPNLETLTGKISFDGALTLSGAQRLNFTPFAKDTTVRISSNWETPSFQGGVLPTSHDAETADAKGFSADWRLPYLARGIAGSGTQVNLREVTEGQRLMGVTFLRVADPYQSVERALKYAAMFVGFVFLAYFLLEIASGARAHPAQYILVGLAQAIFYLLLLAFAERIGFDTAFFIAAAMTVGLTSVYAASVFRSRAYGVRAFIILSGIYGLIYTLMRAERHALLAGALASFAAIALTMYFTRKIDWYGDRRRTA